MTTAQTLRKAREQKRIQLSLVPITHGEANAFVEQHHRHSNPTVGHRASIAAAVGDEVVGVAILGRPVARGLDDGWTLEVLRLCVCPDAPDNTCSFLYGASWRAARALGYRKAITYTLKSESGSSLRGAGWKVLGEVTARSWTTPSRPRVDKHPLQERLRWEVAA